MSDDRKSLIEGLGDLDWDSALDEWEKNTFVPEVARDADTNKVAGPVADEEKKKAEEKKAEEAATLALSQQQRTQPATTAPPQTQATTAPPQTPATTKPPFELGPQSDRTLTGGAPEGTLIAPVPRELRDDPSPASNRAAAAAAAAAASAAAAEAEAKGDRISSPGGGERISSPGGPPPSSPPQQRTSVPPGSLRGGLGELFSRNPKHTPSKPMAPVRPGAGGAPPPSDRTIQNKAPPISERTKVAPPSPAFPPTPAVLRRDPTSVTQQIARPPGFDPRAPREDRDSSPPPPAAFSVRPQSQSQPQVQSPQPPSSARGGVGAVAAGGDEADALSERESERTLIKSGGSGSPLEKTLTEDSGSVSISDFPPDDVTAERPAARGLGMQEAKTLTMGSRGASGTHPHAREAQTPDHLTSRPDLDVDDENATVVRDRVGSLSDAETANRLPADDEMPTIGRPSGIPPIRVSGPHLPFKDGSTPGVPSVQFTGERPVSRWLDEQKTKSFLARILFLEEEARAATDPTTQGRALLAVSELCALVGDNERALNFAMEARDIAPHLPLASRQARQLMPREPEVLAEALDAEAGRSPTPSARAHATLLAADILRIHDRGDAAVERWESACKLDPADTRGPIARAALALAQDDHTSGALRLAENSELIAFDKAVATALRLRGVERPGAEVDDMPINDGLRHARNALSTGDVVAAAQSAGEIATLPVPEISKGALWLSAALGAAHIASRRAAARALKTLANDGEVLARRALASRGIELGDPELVTIALASDDTPLSPQERATLRVLSSKGVNDESPLKEADVEALLGDKTLAPLLDALSALSPIIAKTGDDDDAVARSERVAGKPEARQLATLGRLLAAKASEGSIDGALAEIESPRPASAGGVAIETAVRGKRWGELSEALSSLPSTGDGSARHIAAAIVAERAGNRERAKEAWTEAAEGDTLHDGIVRIAADLDREIDLGAELLRLANEMPDGITSSVLRLEAIARDSVPEEEQGAVLERAHRGAPPLGIGAFLAERIGRQRGDVDEVLRWIQERRVYATDPLETALDAVREALLVADRDPELASTRLEEAHRARPDDVALRELYERLAVEPPTDRGTWREKRAEAATGRGAALLWIEAALEHERAGDVGAALRATRKAVELGDRGLTRPMIERTEIDSGDTSIQTEELIQVTKNTDDESLKREALERLAALDAFSKGGVKEERTAAALLWHRTILESTERHKASLRFLEHVFITEGRDDELMSLYEQIALALDNTQGGESTAHAQHAARLRARDMQPLSGPHDPGVWERTHDMARLAATQPESSLWALRTLNAHARAMKDEEAILKTTLALLERTQRPPERASLLLRASESAARLQESANARTFLEQAANEDPGDVVTWGFLAEVRERAGEARGAAEACESLARTSVVREHQLLAWHDASKIWTDEVRDTTRAMSALEAAAEIDSTYADIFPRLSALYADKHLDSELARLLEKRLGTIEDIDERVGLEVDLARAFAEMGEMVKAKASLDSALEKRPDHTTALGAMADLCAKEGDWTGAEQAYVRLARLLTDPAEQLSIYERLGEIYAVHAPNLSRAEVAFKEVLKRSPDNAAVLAKLVDVYKRSGDVQRAVETQQEIVAGSTDQDSRLTNLVELAKIHETVGRDPRRSEQVLDSARKEFPTSVVALRAMAEFYSRQRQMPAMQILLDRAAGDARRSFAQGRFVPALFQVLHAAFELRGKRDAARVVAATLAAVEGQSSDLMGAEARAVDPRLDDILAPDIMSPALRALFYRAGDALDAVAPVDLRMLRASPLQPGTPIGATVGSVATVIGLGALQIIVSPQLGRVAMPLSSNPPTLLVGEGLAKVKHERARVFVVVRAMKMILAHASAMLRGSKDDVSSLIAGLFCTFNPGYHAQGVDQKRVSDFSRRIGPALPRNLDPTVGVIALEAAGMLGTQWSQLAPAASAWANRVALLAVGDPNAALDAIAWSQNEDAAPTGSEERAAWIARHAEARDLMTFSVTDAYSEARSRLGLDK